MQVAPLYEDVADAPTGGKAWWVTAGDGIRLRVAIWPATDRGRRAGTVLLFPGRTEYVEKYGRVAQVFTRHGYAVLTLDWRGQGLSDRLLPERRLGHIRHFADYQRDVATLLNVAESRALSGPFFLVAHSMGGCIGLRALHDGLPVAAAAFSAPMWGVHMSAREWLLARVIAFFGPMIGLGNRPPPGQTLESQLVAEPFEGNDLTSDRATWDFMKAQIDRYPDLALGGPSLYWLRAALLETARLSPKPPPDVPVLTYLGSNERVVSPAAIRRRMACWPGGRLEIVPGAEHEIMMERAEVRDAFLAEAHALFVAQS